jgi:predicted glycoside hydrolase/deacetylase ChbG (UPF0249 family)
MTRLILCADDYGIAPGVSRAILRLLEQGRLSATSCMTGSRFWPEHAGWLRPLAEHCDIGLHLTLTDRVPLGTLMRRAALRQIDRDAIAAELRRQLDAFQAAFERPPAFIDGHQHVHLLPVIRDAVTALWHDHAVGPQTWLRICDNRISTILRQRVATTKTLFLAALARPLRRLAARAGIPVNDRFAGVRSFEEKDYASLFARFTAEADGTLLVMCHPGEVDDALRAVDSLTDAREQELRFFAGDIFPALLAQRGLTLSRFA